MLPMAQSRARGAADLRPGHIQARILGLGRIGSLSSCCPDTMAASFPVGSLAEARSSAGPDTASHAPDAGTPLVFPKSLPRLKQPHNRKREETQGGGDRHSSGNVARAPKGEAPVPARTRDLRTGLTSAPRLTGGNETLAKEACDRVQDLCAPFQVFMKRPRCAERQGEHRHERVKTSPANSAWRPESHHRTTCQGSWQRPGRHWARERRSLTPSAQVGAHRLQPARPGGANRAGRPLEEPAPGWREGSQEEHSWLGMAREQAGPGRPARTSVPESNLGESCTPGREFRLYFEGGGRCGRILEK